MNHENEKLFDHEDVESSKREFSQTSDDLSDDEFAIAQVLGLGGISRRDFMQILGVSGVSTTLINPLTTPKAHAKGVLGQHLNGDEKYSTQVTMHINGTAHQVVVDNRRTLLEVLREDCQLTGTKKGCDHGQCGACTVIVNGERKLSCLTLAAKAESAEITSIEGIANGGELHPMQNAFIRHDGFQCGFCTPGQICSAVALQSEIERGDASFVTENVAEKIHDLSVDEIKERMSGNICRCSAYQGIVNAIAEVTRR